MPARYSLSRSGRSPIALVNSGSSVSDQPSPSTPLDCAFTFLPGSPGLRSPVATWSPLSGDGCCWPGCGSPPARQRPLLKRALSGAHESSLQQGLTVVLFAQSAVAPNPNPPNPKINPNPNPKIKDFKKLPPPPPPLPQPAQVDVRVEIVRGPAGPGEMVVAQAADRGQGVRLEYLVPATEIYRIRIVNNGTTMVTVTQVGMVAK